MSTGLAGDDHALDDIWVTLVGAKAGTDREAYVACAKSVGAWVASRSDANELARTVAQQRREELEAERLKTLELERELKAERQAHPEPTPAPVPQPPQP